MRREMLIPKVDVSFDSDELYSRITGKDILPLVTSDNDYDRKLLETLCGVVVP